MNYLFRGFLLTQTREQLRDFTRRHGIRRGKNKQDTVENILDFTAQFTYGSMSVDSIKITIELSPIIG